MCYSCCQSRELCENDLQCKEYLEKKRNAPSIAQMFMSKRGANLQKTDSSYSINSSQNDRNDTSSAGTEEGLRVNDTSSAGME